MTSRAEFTAAFAERLRFVLQKHDRETQARAAHLECRYGPGDTGYAASRARLMCANTKLDAAINELADFVFDRLEEKAPLEPCA